MTHLSMYNVVRNSTVYGATFYQLTHDVDNKEHFILSIKLNEIQLQDTEGCSIEEYAKANPISFDKAVEDMVWIADELNISAKVRVYTIQND
jgi:hypothetical protein